MKGKQRRSISGSALWKYCQHVALLQTLLHVVHHPHGIAWRFTGNVQRARRRGQSPHNRPVLHVRVRNKTTMLGRVHDHDVCPRTMHGCQQHGALSGLTTNHQLECKSVQHANGPYLDEAFTLHRSQLWKHAVNDPKPFRQMHQHPQHAPGSAQWFHAEAW